MDAPSRTLCKRELYQKWLQSLKHKHEISTGNAGDPWPYDRAKISLNVLTWWMYLEAFL